MSDEKIAALQNELEHKSKQVRKLREEAKSAVEAKEKIKTLLKKNGVQTTEMLAYLRNEIMKKDSTINEQKKEIGLLKAKIEKFKEHQTKLEKEYKEGIQTAVSSALVRREQELEEKMKTIDDEMIELSFFKKNKLDIESSLHAAKSTIERQAERFQITVEALEKKLIIDLQREREKTDAEIARIRKNALKEAQNLLDQKSKSLQRANIKMTNDLTFHEKNCKRLYAENEKLKKQVKELSFNQELFESSNTEILKRSAKQSKRNRQLREKNLDLEHSLSTTLREVKKEQTALVRANVKRSSRKDEELEVTKNALQIVQQELRRVRKHAHIILKERTECEEFFHEALEQVKADIQVRQEEQYYAQETLWKQSLLDHGIHGEPLKVSLQKGRKGRNSHEVVIRKPELPKRILELKDLSLEDRERVLKLLLYKINNGEEEKVNRADAEFSPKPINEEPYIPGETFITEQTFH